MKKILATLVMTFFLLVLRSGPAPALDVTANLDGTYTITGDATETALLQRAIKEHSPTILKEVLDGWLLGERRFFDQRDKDAFRAKFDKLSPTDQKAVLDKLNTVTLDAVKSP